MSSLSHIGFWRAPIAFAVSAAITALLLPLAARLAYKMRAVDHPGGRRLHLAKVPRLGGVAVVMATLGTCVVLALVAQALGMPIEDLTLSSARMPLVGALMIFALGVLDDLRGVSPRLKLVVQVIAAVLVVREGGLAQSVVFALDLPAFHVDGLVPVLAVLWIVGVTNAFNLIDGLDGLASVCAVVALVTMVVSGHYLGQVNSFVFVAALLGALTVFVRRNWHPASVFLGDAGSMTIGFLLAVRAIPSASDADGRFYALVPLAAFAYPLLDTWVAIIRRWLRGYSFSRADQRHIHHQLVALGMSVPRAVRVIAIVATVVSAAGLTVSYFPSRFTVAVVISASLLASLLAPYVIWRLGYYEFIELGKAVYSGLARSRRIVRERIRMSDITERIKLAGSEAELHACVFELVDVEHVRLVELVDPTELALNARERRGEPVSETAVMVRLVCSVRRERLGRVLQLRVWVTPKGVAHHSLQRVEHMICTELEAWFERFDRPAASERTAEPAVKVTARDATLLTGVTG
jgi:UDP-GlcNAc:undecaprenyl-phosphate GlcNAc-1-phosphate transferase